MGRGGNWRVDTVDKEGRGTMLKVDQERIEKRYLESGREKQRITWGRIMWWYLYFLSFGLASKVPKLTHYGMM